MAYDWTQDVNCKGAWLFTEGTGITVDDSSSNSNVGNFKASGEPAWDTTDVNFAISGAAPNSANFDGINDYINVGTDASLDLTTGITFVGLVYADSLVGEHAIVVRRLDNSASYGFDIRESGKVEFYFNDGSWWETKTTNIEISVSTWTHTAITYDSITKPLIYVNGVAKATNDIGTYPDLPVNAALNTYLGSYNSSASFFDGLITETGLFDIALDSTDINDIMNYGLKQSSVTATPLSMLLGVG